MKSYLSFSLLVFFASFSLVGCNLEDKLFGDGIHRFQTNNFKSLEDELSKASLNCKDSSDCPENIGLMYLNSDGGQVNPRLNQCTGFLVASDIVATNRHCIPSFVRLYGDDDSCSSRVAIRFNTAKGVQIYPCRKMISYSRDTDTADYAFFKIDPTDIQPFVIRKNGLQENEPIKIKRITPTPHVDGGILEVDECKIVTNSLMSYFSTAIGPWAVSAFAIGCEAVGGNSGSPVLDQNNAVVGILQAYLRPGAKAELRKEYDSYKLDYPKNFPVHGLFTNLSCVDDPISAKPFSDECYRATQKFQLKMCLDEKTATLSDMSHFYGEWQKKLPEIFVFKIKKNLGSKKAVATPICVKAKNAFNEYDDFVHRGAPYQKSSEVLKLNMKLQAVPDFELSLNDQFRVVHIVRENPLSQEEFKLNISKNVDSNLWKGKMDIPSFFKDRPDGGTGTVELETCTDHQLRAGHLSFIVNEMGDTVPEAEYFEKLESFLTPDSLCRVL